MLYCPQCGDSLGLNKDDDILHCKRCPFQINFNMLSKCPTCGENLGFYVDEENFDIFCQKCAFRGVFDLETRRLTGHEDFQPPKCIQKAEKGEGKGHVKLKIGLTCPLCHGLLQNIIAYFHFPKKETLPETSDSGSNKGKKPMVETQSVGVLTLAREKRSPETSLTSVDVPKETQSVGHEDLAHARETIPPETSLTPVDVLVKTQSVGGGSSLKGTGSELTVETQSVGDGVIAGALDPTTEIVKEAMTQVEDIFSIDINAKLDSEMMKLIREKGYSKVPVYYEQENNIIGLLLVKNLLTIKPEEEVPVKNVNIRKILRVPETLPLLDLMKYFKEGRSRMAVVIMTDENVKEGLVDSDGTPQEKLKRGPKTKKGSEDNDLKDHPLPKLVEGGEAIGIITMTDAFEELYQRRMEIFDETDHNVED